MNDMMGENAASTSAPGARISGFKTPGLIGFGPFEEKLAT